MEFSFIDADGITQTINSESVGNKVFHVDCMVALRATPDKFYDLCICDPPYFSDYGKEIYPGAAVSTTGIKRNRFHSKHWDIPGKSYFDELQRVSANQIIWGFNYFDAGFLGSGRIVWDKENDASSFSKCEIAYCSFHKSVQIFRYMWNGMLQGNMKDKESRIHPTQKPIALYDWIIVNYAKDCKNILDTHVGSGSSRIAAHKHGKEFIGFEIDKGYWDAQEKRYQQFIAQGTLF